VPALTAVPGYHCTICVRFGGRRVFVFVLLICGSSQIATYTPMHANYCTQFRSNWVVDPSTGDYNSTIRSPTGIAADPELTAHGVEQARELAVHLMTLDPSIDQVYSSPYYRCLQTVEPFVQLKSEQLKSAHLDSSAAEFRVRGETGISEYVNDQGRSSPLDSADSSLLQMVRGRTL